MKYFALFLLLSLGQVVFAQKPSLNTSTFNNWTEVGGGAISPDGKFVCYTIHNQPTGSRSLVVQSTTNSWKKVFINGSLPSFTGNSQKLVFKLGLDSLCLLTLGKEEIVFISDVSSYKMPLADRGQWLAYELFKPQKQLVLRNLGTARETVFLNVASYLFSDSANYLLMEMGEAKDSSMTFNFQYVDLAQGSVHVIWSSIMYNKRSVNYTFDAAGEQLAFMVEKQKGGQLLYELWYYKIGDDTLVLLVNEQTESMEKGLKLSNQKPTFSKNSKNIYFAVESVTEQRPKTGLVDVDVWSYTDTRLQSVQLDELNFNFSYASVINIETRRIIRLEHMNEQIIKRSDNWVLIMHQLGNTGLFESNWNLAAQFSYFLISITDGSRKLVKDHIINPFEGLGMSPEGKWLIYYDFRQKNYFSYEISSGVIRNITKACSTSWIDKERQKPEPSLAWVPWINTWLEQDAALLVYDSYDIWQIDPRGIKFPVNVTNSYGRKHHIKFEVLEEGDMIQSLCTGKKSTLLLKAFDKDNKNMGFYSKVLGVRGDPSLRSMAPCVYGTWGGYGTYNSLPIRARDTNEYLLVRMTATEAPNYFTTDDFKKITPISHVEPQGEYNWMTTELIHWKDLDGRISAGILYRPENFDKKRKYPIIFDCYERRSDELNLYIRPIAAGNRINIPWFVSHGYLVFTPDINYKIGRTGQSAYNSILSAAKYLSQKTWVDAHKMGIQGHSFGGYETNYIITHTNIFAAACSASGFCDLISWYGSAARGGYPMYSTERDQARIGGTPWQIPNLYVANSPIFKADKVTTPLLMMNNRDDNIIPFAQGIEFFTALRRLGKKVWMLQYRGERHSIRSESAAMDYTIRMSQFFDHYLKEAPPPKWMTRGISAKQKGIEYGLDLDDEISTPPPALNLQLPRY